MNNTNAQRRKKSVVNGQAEPYGVGSRSDEVGDVEGIASSNGHNV